MPAGSKKTTTITKKNTFEGPTQIHFHRVWPANGALPHSFPVPAGEVIASARISAEHGWYAGLYPTASEGSCEEKKLLCSVHLQWSVYSQKGPILQGYHVASL